MRKSGEIAQWNDERGFGFIRDAEGRRSFVHISSIKRATTRPQTGERVTFQPGLGEDGRPVAKAVVLVGATPREAAPPRSPRYGSPRAGITMRLLAAATITGLALAAMQLGYAPTFVPVGYLVLGIASMATYWADKNAAEGGRWRVPESRLHALDLVGGIAGGLVAQALLRHKTRKPGFGVVTGLVAVAHIGALAALVAQVWSFPV